MENSLTMKFADAFRDIARRLEEGNIMSRNIEYSINSDEDDNINYILTATVPVEVLINGEYTYGE